MEQLHNSYFTILTPFLPLSFKGEGDGIGSEGAKPLQSSPINNLSGGKATNGVPN